MLGNDLSMDIRRSKLMQIDNDKNQSSPLPGKNVKFGQNSQQHSPLGEKSLTDAQLVEDPPDFETIDKDMRAPLYTDSDGNDVFYPWFQPLDEIAPEELDTPDLFELP